MTGGRESEHAVNDSGELRQSRRFITRLDCTALSWTRKYERGVQLHQVNDTLVLGISTNKLIKKTIKSTNPRVNPKKINNTKKKLKLHVSDVYCNVVGITIAQICQHDTYPQVPTRQAIKTHDQRAIDAVIKEYAQLNNDTIFDPQNTDELSQKTKREALNLLTMMKEKIYVKMKGRAYASGRKQRRYIRKEDVASLHVKLESLFLSLLTTSYECRDMW